MLSTLLSGAGLGLQVADMFGGKKAGKKAEKEQRRYIAEVNKIYKKMERRYQPGGAFQQLGNRQIQEAKTSATGAGMQRLISSGMVGGETGVGMEAGWEKGVGIPARLSLEDISAERLSQIQREKAQMLGGRAAEQGDLARELGRYTPQLTDMLGQGASFLFGSGATGGTQQGLMPYLKSLKKPRYPTNASAYTDYGTWGS
jgi:hypothetical protein